MECQWQSVDAQREELVGGMLGRAGYGAGVVVLAVLCFVELQFAFASSLVLWWRYQPRGREQQ